MTDKLVCHFIWDKGTNTEQLGDTRVLNTLYCKYFVIGFNIIASIL